jgi:hypothetical protein
MSLLGRAPVESYGAAYLLFFYGQFRSVLFWAIAGAIGALATKPRTTAPLLVGGAIYLLLISCRTPLFHFRYTLPVLFIIPLFAGFGVSLAASWCDRYAGRFVWPMRVVVALLFGLSVWHGRFQWRPALEYDLGPTALQSPWETAYGWLSDAMDNVQDPAQVATFSTFPMFHDFYLGASRGRKYFLPFSLHGTRGMYQTHSRYSEAVTVNSLAQLTILKGFVVLDAFGLRMLENRDIHQFLLQRRPVHVEKGPRSNDVVIWRL